MEHFFPKEIHEFIQETLKEIEQRKKGIVTDMMKQEQAIKNIPLLHIKNFSEDECVQIWKIHKSLLGRAFNINKGNEIAVVCDLDSYVYRGGFAKQRSVIGTENEVNILKDEKAREIIRNAENISVFITHNHPKSSSFSFDDMLMFVYIYNIRLLSIVGNDGHIEYILRDKDNYQNDIYKIFTSIISSKDEYTLELSNKYNKKPENILVSSKIVKELILNMGKTPDYSYRYYDPKLKEDNSSENIITSLIKEQDFFKAYELYGNFANILDENYDFLFMKDVIKVHGTQNEPLKKAVEAITDFKGETPEFMAKLMQGTLKLLEYQEAFEREQVKQPNNKIQNKI